MIWRVAYFEKPRFVGSWFKNGLHYQWVLLMPNMQRQRRTNIPATSHCARRVVRRSILFLLPWSGRTLPPWCGGSAHCQRLAAGRWFVGRTGGTKGWKHFAFHQPFKHGPNWSELNLTFQIFEWMCSSYSFSECQVTFSWSLWEILWPQNWLIKFLVADTAHWWKTEPLWFTTNVQPLFIIHGYLILF